MSLELIGEFGFDVYDSGLLVAKRRFRNGITKTAIHDAFDTHFSNGSPAAAWYLGLIDDSGFTAVDNDLDTIASHGGWTEITTEYDEATRPAWGPDASASQTIANSSKAIFTMNASVSIGGMFLVSENTKGGATGILWSTGILDIIQTTQPGQLIKAYYSLLGQEG